MDPDATLDLFSLPGSISISSTKTTNVNFDTSATTACRHQRSPSAGADGAGGAYVTNSELDVRLEVEVGMRSRWEKRKAQCSSFRSFSRSTSPSADYQERASAHSPTRRTV